MNQTDDLQRLRELRKLSTQEGILSVYLPIDPNVSTHRGYVPALMDILKPLREDESDPRHARIEAEAERVLAYVRDNTPQGTAFVAFSSQPAGIWETFSFQLPIEGRARWGARPHLLPVHALLDDFPAAVLALVDQRDARIYVLRLGNMEREARVVGHAPGRQRQGGWSAFRYERDRSRHVQEHFEDVAHEIAEAAESVGAQYVVLAGSDENTSALAQKLPGSLTALLAGSFRAEMFATDASLAEGAGAVLDAAERRHERDVAQHVIDAALSGGRGALGIAATLRMLNEGRVHRLVVSEDALHRPEAEAAFTMAEDAGVDIEVVHDDGQAALAAHDGIGAVLRY